MGILPIVAKRLSAEMQAQRDELILLRGDLTQEQWAEGVLGVKRRTYIRYELGQRKAPVSVMRLARLATAKPKKRTHAR